MLFDVFVADDIHEVQDYFFVFFITLEASAQGKLMEQPHALEIVEKGLFCIYNTDSEKADDYINQVERLMPQHPVAPMMKALNTNWSSNPIESNTEEFDELIEFLEISLNRTKKYLDEEPEDMEAVFFAMAIYGWLAQFYDEDGHTFKALNSAKKAYHYMKIGFEMLDESPEFYFSTGLYNYYRVQYPESNPVYKPFVWFFRDGDKKKGLEQLAHASRNAIFTKAESSMYLAHIYLRYENNAETAVKYSQNLVNSFPGNVFFKVNYTEALLAANKYDQALPIIQRLLEEEKDFYRMSGEIFYGIYLEKHLSDLSEAKRWYQRSLITGEEMGARSENKKSLCYAGLARIADKNGDKDKAKEYYRSAQKLAQYDQVKLEAKTYLRHN